MTRSVAAARAHLAAALTLVVLACDSGTTPTAHDHVADGGICGHVDDAVGILLVSHSDTVAVQTGVGFDPHYPNRIAVGVGGLVHAIHATFIDGTGGVIDIAGDCTINSLRFVLDDPRVATITQDDPVHLRFHFNVTGVRAGTAHLKIRLFHEDHSHFESLDIPIVVSPATGG